MTDAFEAARKADEAARAKADVPKEAKEKSTKPNVSSERQGQVAQHEIRSQLQALAESKLRAVENEDFELAEKLKHQEQELQQLCPTKSWASLVVDRIPPPAAQRGSRGENTVFRRGVGMVPKAGPAPRGAPAAPPPVSGSAGGCAGGCAAAMSATRQAAGKLVFVLTAPGELTPESFKATTTHVARRDALARIATAALWRGRGLPWDDIHEIVFIFEDYRALHMSPRFVASCPVPSEYHMIMVLQRALEGTQMPGLHISAPDRERFLGGHIDDMVAQYAHSGPTSVVLLHEAYPQSLGLYDDNLRSDTAGESSKRTLLFFLGAVKDMTPEESRAVVKACRAREVPCVEANLGQHAEFTSKIIDVLHGHHLYRRLAPAVAFRARRAAASAGAGAGGAGGVVPPQGTFWVFVPMSGSPREMVADDKKKDGQYEIPRCCISQLWCSKSEHRCHALSFVYPGGEVLTVNPSLVTCLKLQHRAAPTERNLVSALRVASGDWRADPNLTVDEGCVVLGDAGNVMAKRGEALHPQRTALLDLEVGSEGPVPRLDPYTGSSGKGLQNVVVLLHQSGARDFPRNFRSQLLKGLFPKGTSKTWTQLAMPRLSIHASISLLGHFWDTRALTRALEKIPGVSRAQSQEPAANEAAPIKILQRKAEISDRTEETEGWLRQGRRGKQEVEEKNELPLEILQRQEPGPAPDLPVQPVQPTPEESDSSAAKASKPEEERSPTSPIWERLQAQRDQGTPRTPVAWEELLSSDEELVEKGLESAYVAGEVLLVISGMWRYVEISNLMISLERFEVINAWRCSSDGGKLDENCGMYGLRLINNFYADFAGTRSDFVVVGHPEYNLGKVRSDYGYKERVLAKSRSEPQLAVRGGSEAELPGAQNRSPSMRRNRKEPSDRRVGQRSAITSSAAAQWGGKIGPASARGNVKGSGKIFACLSGDGELLAPAREETVAMYTREELESLRGRVQRSPDAVKVELEVDDAWRAGTLNEKASLSDLRAAKPPLRPNSPHESSMMPTRL
ncbi:unnamed protein product [Durusdinium trenchii]|uniref:Uncharacterized protein n=1 Tax=Durusdinium trenchii TaxID=1381693 RepID=A0ABP0HJG9_9DINO